jgi:hypothetical protein
VEDIGCGLIVETGAPRHRVDQALVAAYQGAPRPFAALTTLLDKAGVVEVLVHGAWWLLFAPMMPETPPPRAAPTAAPAALHSVTPG